MNIPIRIYTWVSADETLPPPQRAIARLQMQMVGKKGKVIWDWSPVILSAETENAARDKAQAWFDEQVAMEVRKQANTEKRVAAMKARREVIQ